MSNGIIENSGYYMMLEDKFGAHNYHSIPVVLSKGEGVYVYDVEGNKYYDFLSAYSAVNQGHCHPQILEALIEQAKKLTLCSRAFYNDKLGQCEEFLAKLFNYDKVLLMNSGAEANETAYKLCRKWGYGVKKIPENQAKVIFCNNNFSGRTLACISASTDPTCTTNFGPFMPNFLKIEYDNLEALEEVLKDPCVCAFFVEPIQGEGGVIKPSEDYIKSAYNLCKKYNVLFVADEIQTGLGRTGKLLCCDHSQVKPDVVILGKALSGGFYPISAVLANDDIMLQIKPGEHGSTYGGNPLASQVCIAAVNVIIKEKLCEQSAELGDYFLQKLKQGLQGYKIIKDIRGKGLFCAIEFDDRLVDVWDVTLKLKEQRLLTKAVHEKTLRLAPPLIITKEQLDDCINIIVKVMKCIEQNVSS